MGNSLQFASKVHGSSFASEKASDNRERIPLQHVSDLPASPGSATISENRGTDWKHLEAPSESLGEKGGHQQLASPTRSRSWSGSSRGALNEAAVNVVKRQSSPMKSPAFLHRKAQELSQALASNLSSGSMKREEIETAIKDRVRDILNDTIPLSSDISQAALKNGNRFRCDQCSKQLKRHCDLKYVPGSWYLRPQTLTLLVESIKNDTPGRMDVPTLDARSGLAVKMTGKGTRTLGITRLRPGVVRNPTQRVKSTSVRRFSTAGSNIKLISETIITSKTRETSVSEAKRIA